MIAFPLHSMESYHSSSNNHCTAAFLIGGGTAPGWNAVKAGGIEAAEKEGNVTILGILKGFRGLLQPGAIFKNIKEYIPENDLDKLRKRAGSILGSSRVNPKPSNDQEQFEENLEIIAHNIERNKIDIIFTVGGDDTLNGAKSISRIIPVIHIPKTIDFDIRIKRETGYESLPTFGFDSAAERGRMFAEGMWHEAELNGEVSVLESMGRDAGFLTAEGGMRMQEGKADIFLLPEFEVSKDQCIARIQEAVRENGDHALILVSEGFLIDGKKIYISKEGTDDGYHHGRLGGVRFIIEEWAQEAGFKTKQNAPGYQYRSGPPTDEDLTFADRLGKEGMEAGLRGESSKVVALEEKENNIAYGKIGLVDFDDVSGGGVVPKEKYDPDRLEMKKPHESFVDKTISLETLAETFEVRGPVDRTTLDKVASPHAIRAHRSHR